MIGVEGQIEIDYCQKKVLIPNNEGHSNKTELDFNDINNSGVLHYLDSKSAYNLGVSIGAFNTEKINHIHLNHSF
ncbi:MAG: hypothetical protein GY750_15055 [Lentisphaerae bacterium]|nr:hypothetical protein [Lentisphaerota bacterium]MCP4102717.1 hypothetical protein [Lentisphaerota bacterium]